jgi:hypothetical protein
MAMISESEERRPTAIGQDDDVREGEQQKLGHGPGRERAANDHPGHVEELLHEDDRGVEGEPQDGGADHLLEDVAGQDVHPPSILRVMRDFLSVR